MKNISWLICLAVILYCQPVLNGTVNDSQSYALEIATEYVEDGFSVRYEFWDGELKPGEQKAIRHQLFKGNEYWFWLASDLQDVKLEIHVYDSKGNLVEAESWQRDHFAAVRVVPLNTGTYILLVQVNESNKGEPASWSLAYGYR